MRSPSMKPVPTKPSDDGQVWVGRIFHTWWPPSYPDRRVGVIIICSGTTGCEPGYDKVFWTESRKPPDHVHGNRWLALPVDCSPQHGIDQGDGFLMFFWPCCWLEWDTLISLSRNHTSIPQGIVHSEMFPIWVLIFSYCLATVKH